MKNHGIFSLTKNQPRKGYTMAKAKVASEVPEVKQFFTENKDFLKKLVQNSVQEIMNAEMSNDLNADAYEAVQESAKDIVPGITAGFCIRV